MLQLFTSQVQVFTSDLNLNSDEAEPCRTEFLQGGNKPSIIVDAYMYTA